MTKKNIVQTVFWPSGLDPPPPPPPPPPPEASGDPTCGSRGWLGGQDNQCTYIQSYRLDVRVLIDLE